MSPLAVAGEREHADVRIGDERDDRLGCHLRHDVNPVGDGELRRPGDDLLDVVVVGDHEREVDVRERLERLDHDGQRAVPRHPARVDEQGLVEADAGLLAEARPRRRPGPERRCVVHDHGRPGQAELADEQVGERNAAGDDGVGVRQVLRDLLSHRVALPVRHPPLVRVGAGVVDPACALSGRPAGDGEAPTLVQMEHVRPELAHDGPPAGLEAGEVERVAEAPPPLGVLLGGLCLLLQLPRAGLRPLDAPLRQPLPPLEHRANDAPAGLVEVPEPRRDRVGAGLETGEPAPDPEPSPLQPPRRAWGRFPKEAELEAVEAPRGGLPRRRPEHGHAESGPVERPGRLAHPRVPPDSALHLHDRPRARRSPPQAHRRGDAITRARRLPARTSWFATTEAGTPRARIGASPKEVE